MRLVGCLLHRFPVVAAVTDGWSTQSVAFNWVITLSDLAPPTAALSTAATSVETAFSVSSTFSEPVNDLTITDFSIRNGTASDLTGSGANLLAGAMIAGAIGASDFFYADWLVAALPLALTLYLIGWFIGTRIVFPIKAEERRPSIEGGMDYLRQELAALGKPSLAEPMHCVPNHSFRSSR